MNTKAEAAEVLRPATQLRVYEFGDGESAGSRPGVDYSITRILLPENLPTPIRSGHSRPRIDIAEVARSRRFPLLDLARRFGGHMLRNWVGKLTGSYDEEAAAVRLRNIFEDLGGLWIKVGQLIAMRNDLFSDAICLQLSRLQSRAVGFPLEKVRESIRADFGAEIEDLFATFEAAPFAAASISQVHLAELPESRTKVCVKVLRPDARQSFERDLKSIHRLVKLMGSLGPFRYLHLDDAYYELELMVREELDFRYEAANMRRMRKSLKDHTIYVPRVFKKLCGQRVLTSEFVDGVLMTDFIDLGRIDREAQKAWCAENRIKPKTIARTLFHSALRQLFEDNLFHADIHPGNIILLRGNRLALIDFGTIGTSSNTFLINYRSSLSALAAKDFAKAADVTMQMAVAPPALDDIKPLRKELIRLYREWDGRSGLKGVEYHERSLAAAGGASGKIMARYKVQLSWDFMRVSRTWATLDASISHLYPDADYMDLFRTYFSAASRRATRLSSMIPKALHMTQRVAAAAIEYEALIGSTIRTRAIYSSSAGQMSERFAMALVAFLKMVKWLLYVAAIGGASVLLDVYSNDVNLFEHELLAVVEQPLKKLGVTGVILFGLIAAIFIRFIRQSIGRLDARS